MINVTEDADVHLSSIIAENDFAAIKLAVKGMLPRTPLGRSMFRKLKVYAGAEHPHTAQRPQTVKL